MKRWLVVGPKQDSLHSQGMRSVWAGRDVLVVDAVLSISDSPHSRVAGSLRLFQPELTSILQLADCRESIHVLPYPWHILDHVDLD